MAKEYYLGLDVGTNSVGYAVTDKNYNLFKFKGEPMWGSHVFEDGKNAEERRGFRTSRRRLERRKQRINLVQEIFAREIAKIDERFFIRLKEAGLWREDVADTDRYILFSDDKHTDKEYFHKYPTIHHLLCDLMTSDEPHDVRLVYLAVAWLIAHRGHFLNEMDKNNVSAVLDFDSIFQSVNQYMKQNEIPSWDEGKKVLLQNALCEKQSISSKEKELVNILYEGKKPKVKDDDTVDLALSIKLLAGGTVKADKLFPQCDYDESVSLCFADGEEKFAESVAHLAEEASWVLLLRQMYDWSLLKDAVQGCQNVSEGKVKIYNQHKQDLQALKIFVRKYVPEKYNKIFRATNKNDKNYVAYSYHVKGLKGDLPKNKASIIEFNDFLKKTLKDISVADEDQVFYDDMMKRLELHSFMPKQVNGDNRVIPYQLYYNELVLVLNKAEKYLPFLLDKDNEGYTNRDKLLAIFTFRIPYFVGPLNSASKYAWLKRKSTGKIRPWNFEAMVDFDKSEEEFIRRMTNKCTYLPAEDVLPLNSMLYQKFMVLNEINPIKINGNAITVDAKKCVYDLFHRRRKVTYKAIVECLQANNYMQKDDVLSGVDKTFHSALKTYHDFRSLMERKKLTINDVERIVERLTYSEEKRRIQTFLLREYPQISEEDRKYISRLKYQDFGRLSRKFLHGLKGVDKETGETAYIIDFLWNSNSNLMQLLSEKYTFKDEIDKIRKDYYTNNGQSLTQMMDDMRIANAVRRSIYRTLDIVDEVCKANGCPPKKIFLEMARGGGEKGKRTLSRREKIQKLYKELDKEYEADVKELSKKLDKCSDNQLQSEVLYLYFLQLGKSLYSGVSINVENLKNDKLYNVDHIYPQCYVKDDSLDNKILCLSKENSDKGDIYPVKGDIRHKMSGVWKVYRKYGLISEKKYNRLMRGTRFTDEEKIGFIQRQLVETRQSTKALAEIFKAKYPDTELVYVKAGLVSDFRHNFDMVKCRLVNDLHHAKDAYLNVVVGNVYHMLFNRQWFRPDDRTYSLKVTTIFSRERKIKDEVVWKGSEDIGKVKNVLAKNNIHYTRYAFERHGALFDQMPVKRSPGLVPRKAGLKTEKYGGYNKTTASYYLLARYLLMGKKPQADIMFVPVTLMAASYINENIDKATGYVRTTIAEILGKEDALIQEITYPLGLRHIKINTMFSFDGFRACLAGKANRGKIIKMASMMSLIISFEDELYIKRLERINTKYQNNKNYQIDSQFDGINYEKNLKIYDLLVNKIQHTIFNNVFANQLDTLINGRQIFINKPLIEQVNVLLNIVDILKVGRCSPCDLTGIGGKSAVAQYTLSSSVKTLGKKIKDIRILDVSAAGLNLRKTKNLLEYL